MEPKAGLSTGILGRRWRLTGGCAKAVRSDGNWSKRGQPTKVALTAVMRKLVVLLNSLLKNPHFILVS